MQKRIKVLLVIVVLLSSIVHLNLKLIQVSQLPLLVIRDLNPIVQRDNPTINLVEEEIIFSIFKDNVLGTGITRDRMKVNDLGWLTYNDKVIVATATSHLIKSPRYNLKKGFHQFDYYDILYIHYDNKIYQAIVLDSCGTCTLGKDNEDYQRVDILVDNDTRKFLTTGKISYIIKEER